jgi:hypothetical protein
MGRTSALEPPQGHRPFLASGLGKSVMKCYTGHQQMNVAGGMLEASPGRDRSTLEVPGMPKLTFRPWTPQEDDYIRQHPTLSCAELGTALYRTINAARNRRSHLGVIEPSDVWTPSELEQLRDWYRARAGKPIDLDGLVKLLGRQKANICRKAREMGLTNQRRPKVEDRKPDQRYAHVPHFANAEERHAYLSAVRKRVLAERGHPRDLREVIMGGQLLQISELARGAEADQVVAL